MFNQKHKIQFMCKNNVNTTIDKCLLTYVDWIFKIKMYLQTGPAVTQWCHGNGGDEKKDISLLSILSNFFF